MGRRPVDGVLTTRRRRGADNVNSLGEGKASRLHLIPVVLGLKRGTGGDGPINSGLDSSGVQPRLGQLPDSSDEVDIKSLEIGLRLKTGDGVENPGTGIGMGLMDDPCCC